MYEQFYHLSEDPFRLTPDPRYAYAHSSYAKARAYLEYGVQRGEGFVAVTGPPGSGKTTLIEELLTRAPPGVRVSHLISSQLEADDLLRMVAHVLGIKGQQAGKANLLQSIREYLEEDRLGGRRTVLIVDEAQGLDSAALEELRLLTNLTDSRGPLLQIILLGQEQLRELLKLPELEQLRQRMIAAYHLRPMSEQDTKDYVAHRLRRADWAGDPVISDMAVRIIHHAGGGNPRRINLLCSRLMLHGYVGGKHYLAVPDVRVVLEEMEEEELASWDESLEELMREEEQREREEEARLASINPAAQVSRLEAVGGGHGVARVNPLTTVSPTADRIEPTLEALHVDEPATSVDDGVPEQAAPAQSRPQSQSAGQRPEARAMPEVSAADRLVEPARPGARHKTAPAPAPPDTTKGWEWLVGAVLVFLLAALVAVTHDPTRARVSQWIDGVRDTLAETLPSGQAPEGGGSPDATEDSAEAGPPDQAE